MLRTARNFGGRAYSKLFATAIDSEKEGEALTKQSEAADTDINNIVAKFVKTGTLPLVQTPPLNEDFSELVWDYQTALNMVLEADRSFNALDAKVRAKFDNDPAKFVAFCNDRENLPEMRKMGLAIPAELEENPPNGSQDSNVSDSGGSGAS